MEIALRIEHFMELCEVKANDKICLTTKEDANAEKIIKEKIEEF